MMKNVNVAFYDPEDNGRIVMIGQGSLDSMILDQMPFVYLPDESRLWDATHRVEIVGTAENLVPIGAA